MKFIRTFFTKIVDYFTANSGRKVFFCGIVVALLVFILYGISHYTFFRIIGLFSLFAMGLGTLWDSMYSRYLFLKKIRDMQYEHLKDITDRQANGEDVVMTPTFSFDEKKYLRRRKWWFILIILFKIGLVIALFSLLLKL
ncbi:MAG: hypothetical protein MJ054_00340 [Clostridia bacterium]|nr:hypothetical protein [Clostridia bacterium]